ncbi:ROK family protein [Massiliimalia timonensis]|uniref:ROK family protein n=1 Tax=Massiliimalia timonensis TaxID=1987501 RepID=UPI00189DA909|nr:ROK family protein [Massiliimalia timonensis]
MDYYLLLDIGGTNVKCGIADKNHHFVPIPQEIFPSNATGSAEQILTGFKRVIHTVLDEIPDSRFKIAGMATSFPGPFDYSRGIPYLTDLNKFESIYGVDLREEWRKNISPFQKSEKIPIRFIHDVQAFALGTLNVYPKLCQERVLYVSLGTGFGTAVTLHGKLVTDPVEGIPAQGWFYHYPFHKGILDDYLSARGLTKLSCNQLGSSCDGRMLGDMARNKDCRAIGIYRQFGQMLAEAIEPLVQQHHFSCLVLGGQIVKSSVFFIEDLAQFCLKRNIRLITDDQSYQRVFNGLLESVKS